MRKRAKKVYKQSAHDRFWSKVNKDGAIILDTPCWEWTGKLCKGYGRFTVDGILYAAHRYAYLQEYGPFPVDKPNACHRCDNPRCVRPDHLFAGSFSDNTQDMIRKGRDNKEAKKHVGEKHPRSKLTVQQVLEIRSKHIPFKYPYSRLAKEYGVAESTISMACRGDNWKELPSS